MKKTVLSFLTCASLMAGANAATFTFTNVDTTFLDSGGSALTGLMQFGYYSSADPSGFDPVADYTGFTSLVEISFTGGSADATSVDSSDQNWAAGTGNQIYAWALETGDNTGALGSLFTYGNNWSDPNASFSALANEVFVYDDANTGAQFIYDAAPDANIVQGVPEPSTGLLAFAGFGLFALRRRRA
ncbi:MAG: PEP-CTERM sorting domain-containing protein [Verrucomicrobiota bacterium]